MGKKIRILSCLTLVVILILSTFSCSILQPEKPQPKPTPKSTPTPKPPDVQKIIRTGITQFESGALNKAIATFKRALKLEPKNSQAAQHLKKSRDEKQRLIQLYLNQGIKYFTDDLLKEALIEWNKVLELDPSHKKALNYKKQTQDRLDALKSTK